MEKAQSETKLIGIFEPLEFIFLSIIVFFFLIIFGLTALDIKTSMPYSVSEFIDYSKILENNISIQACIKKKSVACNGNINITNKKQLKQNLEFDRRKRK